MNTKLRHEEIYKAAVEVLSNNGGVEAIDKMEMPERLPNLRQMYKAVQTETDCHYNTAKRNIAKALRRARYGLRQRDWGGQRAGAGRPGAEK